MNYQISRLQPGLYLVATPIGTARDITLRALDILASADILVAEDTRTLKKLLAIHGVPLGDRPVRSYHDHSGDSARARVVQDITEGRSVAYASEAGTPMVSDPGFGLARAVSAAELMVTGAPGPSAAIAALLLSGLPTDRFLFLGFLPNKKMARNAALVEVADVRASLVCYEAPGRVPDLVDAIGAQLGADRDIAICREVTKRFEEVLRGTAEELSEILGKRALKGECVVVIGPPPVREVHEDDLRAALEALLDEMSVKDAATEVSARLGVARKLAYKLALDVQKDRT